MSGFYTNPVVAKQKNLVEISIPPPTIDKNELFHKPADWFSLRATKLARIDRLTEDSLCTDSHGFYFFPHWLAQTSCVWKKVAA